MWKWGKGSSLIGAAAMRCIKWENVSASILEVVLEAVDFAQGVFIGRNGTLPFLSGSLLAHPV